MMDFHRVIFIVICSLIVTPAVDLEEVKTHVIRAKPISTLKSKIDFEHNVLQAVADKLNGMLTIPQTLEDANAKYASDSETNKALLSVLDEVLDRETGSAPKELVKKMRGMLAQFVSDATHLVRKHDSTFAEKKDVSRHLASSETSTGSKNSASTLPMQKPSNNAVETKPVSPFILSTENKAPLIPVAISKLDQIKNIEDSAKALPETLELTNEEELESTSDPMMKLSLHVVFTDVGGKEYRLVDVRKRCDGVCSSEKCLSLDGKSNEILAYGKPKSNQYLVLRDPSGKTFFTSGSLLCNDINEDMDNENEISNIFSKNRRKVTGKWEDEKQSSLSKRENPAMKEFNKDVEKLFSGKGLEETISSRGMMNNNDKSDTQIRNTSRRRKKGLHMSMKHNRHGSRSSNYLKNPVFSKTRYADDSKGILGKKLLDGVKESGRRLKALEQRENAQSVKCDKNCEILRTRNRRKSSIPDFEDHDEEIDNAQQESSYIESEQSADQQIINLVPNGSEGNTKNEEFSFSLSDDVLSSVQSENQKMFSLSMIQDNLSTETPLPLDLDGKYSNISINRDKIVSHFDLKDFMSGMKNLDITPKEEKGTKEQENQDSFLYSNGAIEFDHDYSGVADQFAHTILFHAHNSPEMEEILGAAINNEQLVTNTEEPSIGKESNYTRSLDLIMKTLKIDLNKIIQEEASSISCISLDKSQQEFLSIIVGLSETTIIPEIYKSNILYSENLKKLVNRRSDLLDILKDYNLLPKNEQINSVGVKGFVESELDDLKQKMTDDAERGKS